MAHSIPDYAKRPYQAQSQEKSHARKVTCGSKKCVGMKGPVYSIVNLKTKVCKVKVVLLES